MLVDIRTGNSTVSASRLIAGSRFQYQIQTSSTTKRFELLRIRCSAFKVFVKHKCSIHLKIMGLNPMRWKTRNVLYLILLLLSIYVLFIYKKKYHANFEGTIKNAEPNHVWEYVADFSNMKKLNPTIEEFNVIAESGNYDHWTYSVEYSERLSHVPIIRNVAQGHYAIRQDNNGYLITSKHNTCFFPNFGCLESISQFRFDRDGANDTKCIETVQYECPIVFSELCHREVMYQRKEIMRRLKLEFSVAGAKSESN